MQSKKRENKRRGVNKTKHQYHHVARQLYHVEVYLSDSVLGSLPAGVVQMPVETLPVGILLGMSCQRPNGLALNSLWAMMPVAPMDI